MGTKLLKENENMAGTSKARKFTLCTNAVVLVMGLLVVAFGLLLWDMQGELVRELTHAYEHVRTSIEGGEEQTDEAIQQVKEAYVKTIGTNLKLDVMGLTLACVGGLVCFISFVGCCGAKTESRRLLCVYVVFISIFIVVAAAITSLLVGTALALGNTQTTQESAECVLAVEARGPTANAKALEKVGSNVYFDCNLEFLYNSLHTELQHANHHLRIPLLGEIPDNYHDFKAALASSIVVVGSVCSAILMVLCAAAISAVIVKRRATNSQRETKTWKQTQVTTVTPSPAVYQGTPVQVVTAA